MNERTPLISTVVVTNPRRRFPHSTFRRFCTIALSSCLVLLVIGFLIPWSVIQHHRHHPHRRPHGHQPGDSSTFTATGIKFDDLKKIILDTPDPARAREWSKYYTSGPHLAGKNLSQALWTRERWEELGVASQIASYETYLTYPLDHRLALVDGNHVKYECSLKEDILEEDPTSHPDIPTFHGYSASGNVTAQYVYVNFGTYQDFEDLVEAGIKLKGKIALAKYGRVFRGLKVKRAQELGMAGVVIYDDPQMDGQMTEQNGHKPYPEGPARNPSSVQRGSVQFLSTCYQDID
jgi:N-acetylated-alpha-linked acidic dipeptidase